MMRVPFASERIQMIDEHTGVKVIQLTSYPTPAAHFLYDWPSITPDNRRIVFFCQRYAGRGAPWDIYRCDTDGMNLFQLTEKQDKECPFGYYGCPPAILSLDGTVIYVIWDTVLCKVDVETGAEEELVSLQKFCTNSVMPSRLYLAADRNILYIDRCGLPNSRPLRLNLTTGEVDELHLDGMLFGCFQKEPRLIVHKCQIKWTYQPGPDGLRRIVNEGEEWGFWSVSENGQEDFICPSIFAHATVLGQTSKLQGCGKPPEHCIWIAEPNKGAKRLVQGPYFWHSGASFDGEWIAADTNWPDQGIQLIHVPTRRYRTLCFPHASQDHVHFGHPHPTVSHDGRLVLFRSDRTGIPQLYIVHVSDEFRQTVISGDLAGFDKII